jgi:5'-deoxynucleotidase YfbR-like HD superfamily hydrolase
MANLMKIAQIYQNYKVMPNLQLHMYRVAAVGKYIAQSSQALVDEYEVTTTCLLHDMANIIKFDLEKFPHFVQPEGMEYWFAVQEDYKKKYGDDEHEATQKIGQELGVSPRIQELMHGVSFHYARQNYESDDFAQKICAYADMRVTPYGITSLAERLEDLERRYSSKYPSDEQRERRRIFSEYLRKIEQQIFAVSDIQADQVTEDVLEDLIANLKNFEIITA